MDVYQVQTECGRNFAWSAEDMDDLFRTLTRRGYLAKKVKLLNELDQRKEVGI